MDKLYSERESIQAIWESRPEMNTTLGQLSTMAPFRPEYAADLFAVLESEGKGIRAKYVFMHPKDAADLRKPNCKWKEVFEEYTLEALLDEEFRGFLWGAIVIVSHDFEYGTVWAVDCSGSKWATATIMR